ncbi:hypothetical protein KCU67_g415, partial [Aureobasidium melanogenum]
MRSSLASLLLGNLAFGSVIIYPSPACPDQLADVVSVGHVVANLTKTVAFYRDIIGLEVLSEDSDYMVDTSYSQLTGTWGGLYKQASIAIPNQAWTYQLIQYAGLNKHAIKNREQDPASSGLTLTVKNSTAINAVLAENNATTINGKSVPVGGASGTTSTVWVYDPDNYMIELVQRSGVSDYFTVPKPKVTTGPGMKYVVRGQLDLTMYNYTQALKFYKDILEFNITAGFSYLIGPNKYEQVGGIGSVFGIRENVTWAAVTGNCDPITRYEYYEYDDLSRISLIYPIQDPGVGVTTYTVTRLDCVVSQIKKANFAIVTPGGWPPS